MPFLTFPGYGVNASDVTVDTRRITHWYQIEYNGRRGTCIVLDTGKEITTELAPSEVQKRIEAAT